MTYQCPTCDIKITRKTDDAGKKQPLSPYFPFCSERCKLIDLGDWLESNYQINTDLFQQEQLQDD